MAVETRRGRAQSSGASEPAAAGSADVMTDVDAATQQTVDQSERVVSTPAAAAVGTPGSIDGEPPTVQRTEPSRPSLVRGIVSGLATRLGLSPGSDAAVTQSRRGTPLPVVEESSDTLAVPAPTVVVEQQETGSVSQQGTDTAEVLQVVQSLFADLRSELRGQAELQASLLGRVTALETRRTPIGVDMSAEEEVVQRELPPSTVTPGIMNPKPLASFSRSRGADYTPSVDYNFLPAYETGLGSEFVAADGASFSWVHMFDANAHVEQARPLWRLLPARVPPPGTQKEFYSYQKSVDEAVVELFRRLRSIKATEREPELFTLDQQIKAAVRQAASRRGLLVPLAFFVLFGFTEMVTQFRDDRREQLHEEQPILSGWLGPAEESNRLIFRRPILSADQWAIQGDIWLGNGDLCRILVPFLEKGDYDIFAIDWAGAFHAMCGHFMIRYGMKPRHMQDKILSCNFRMPPYTQETGQQYLLRFEAIVKRGEQVAAMLSSTVEGQTLSSTTVVPPVSTLANHLIRQGGRDSGFLSQTQCEALHAWMPSVGAGLTLGEVINKLKNFIQANDSLQHEASSAMATLYGSLQVMEQNGANVDSFYEGMRYVVERHGGDFSKLTTRSAKATPPTAESNTILFDGKPVQRCCGLLVNNGNEHKPNQCPLRNPERAVATGLLGRDKYHVDPKNKYMHQRNVFYDYCKPFLDATKVPPQDFEHWHKTPEGNIDKMGIEFKALVGRRTTEDKGKKTKKEDDLRTYTAVPPPGPSVARVAFSDKLEIIPEENENFINCCLKTQVQPSVAFATTGANRVVGFQTAGHRQARDTGRVMGGAYKPTGRSAVDATATTRKPALSPVNITLDAETQTGDNLTANAFLSMRSLSGVPEPVIIELTNANALDIGKVIRNAKCSSSSVDLTLADASANSIMLIADSGASLQFSAMQLDSMSNCNLIHPDDARAMKVNVKPSFRQLTGSVGAAEKVYGQIDDGVLAVALQPGCHDGGVLVTSTEELEDATYVRLDWLVLDHEYLKGAPLLGTPLLHAVGGCVTFEGEDSRFLYTTARGNRASIPLTVAPQWRHSHQ